MSSADAIIQSLRKAMESSPENVALRRHLAETLLTYGKAAEAELEYRVALDQTPQDDGLRLGLANAFYQQGKNSHAFVVVEELLKQPNPPAGAHLLNARLMLRTGEVERAVASYKAAIQRDPSVGDPALAEQLGVRADEPSEIMDGRLRDATEDEPPPPSIDIERPTVTFADIGGMNNVREQINAKIIHPMTHPEIYAAYGKKIGGGILMYGPPGCGKTHLARATAGEVRAAFFAIGINDVVEMWIGQSERNLHELFERARENRPSVLFFDEVDALGASRSDMRQSAGRQLINQFLAELDGMQASNEGVLILAATNAPWHLDSAFRRPGRFDRIIFVPPPDEPARAAILRIQLRGKPVKDVDYEHVAKKTPDFSGADLRAVVDTAVEGKLGQAMRTGVPEPLTTKDLLTAAKSLRPSTKEWFASARNYALYSNQGGIYDDILKFIEKR